MSKNNTILVGNYFKVDNVKSEELIIKHIKLIAEVQKILMKYHSVEQNGIISELGKEFDRRRCIIKKLQKIYDRNSNKCLERLIIKKGEEEINKFNNIKFNELLIRGTYRDEVCIERLDRENLRLTNQIEIGKIKKVSFNIIEEDFIRYLRRIKKYISRDFLDKCINEYLKLFDLSGLSKEYIDISLEFPEKSIRYLYRNAGSEINKERLIKLMIDEELI